MKTSDNQTTQYTPEQADTPAQDEIMAVLAEASISEEPHLLVHLDELSAEVQQFV